MQKLKIHVVDDDPTSLAVATALLESAGHVVTTSSSSVRAEAEIREAGPDCVLLDIMMPELDGLELCKKLRDTSELRELKIVILSGKAYEFDRKRAFALGADGYILKPVRAESFAGELEGILGERVRIKFWGVRGTLPVPGSKSLKYGGNTSCVSINFPRNRLFVFDAGSGIRELSNALQANGSKPVSGKIFISHPHWDHINAIPFFAPLYRQGNDFEILGASHGDISMRELISAQMDGVYFPITIKEFGAMVYFRDLKEGNYEIEGIRVSTMLLSHPGYCLGYRLELNGKSICYVTDNELYLPGSRYYSDEYVLRLSNFVRDADMLVTDTTYTDKEYESREGWGHSCVSQVVDLADRAGVGTLFIVHHDPDQSDQEIDRKLESCASILKGRGSRTRCVAPKEQEEFWL